MFQFDQADLDFGIYRIINQKRAEIKRFLDEDLLPQVKEEFNKYIAGDREIIEKQLDELKRTLENAGVVAEETPRYRELQEQYRQATDVTTLENEVYSHLTNFFKRYYNNGDFLALRRYKKDVYAIPYEGEEVKLHWANADQYYIKTSEYLGDYTFTLPSGGKVHFKLVEASTEQNNNKAQSGKERRFILAQEEPVIEENGELFIRFYYELLDNKAKQAELNTQAIQTIFKEQVVKTKWLELSSLMPTEKNKNRTVLEKHLTDYTAKHSFDYFIHKDLGGFLRREMDFFIKNEIMHLDDLGTEKEIKLEQYIAKIRVVKKIGHKIVRFLEQLENFQKKMWLKKKFVVETNYCITLDRVPEELYPKIAANNEQEDEWRRLFAIEEIKGDGEKPGYSDPLTVEFLKANPYLVLDTAFFEREFKEQLLASIDNLDVQVDGLLVCSENLQALNLLQERYKEQVKCIYIDPPYNANSSEIMYKNTFKHSSWLSLMENRLSISKLFLTKDFVNVTAIDEVEQEVLGQLLTLLFNNCEKSCISIVHNATGQQGSNFSYVHEFAYFIFPSSGKYIGLENREENPDIRPLRNVSKGAHLRSDAANCFYPILVKDGIITGFGDVCPDEFHPLGINIQREDGIVEVYPIDPQGIERKWVFARNTVESILDELEAKYDKNKMVWDIIRTKKRFNFKTVWTGSKYSANSYGSRILNDMLPLNPFSFPKSIYTVRDCIDAGLNNQITGLILDYFAGSGTTAHAVINLNREDGGNRKYILVEMGEYFDSVLKPRIQKVIYSGEWKDGKPVSRKGSSHIFKYIRLESYEDTLNNLELYRTPERNRLFQDYQALREEYLLSYMLDMETSGSVSLLNLDYFNDPFSYRLKIARNQEVREETVDLVETFNYLIGLRVQHYEPREAFNAAPDKRAAKPGAVKLRIAKGDQKDFTFQHIVGTNAVDEKVLVIWRTLSGDPVKDNAALDEYFNIKEFNTRDNEFDRIYVNGDNNLANLTREPNSSWKVLLIEEEFKRLMFDVQDV